MHFSMKSQSKDEIVLQHYFVFLNLNILEKLGQAFCGMSQFGYVCGILIHSFDIWLLHGILREY